MSLDYTVYIGPYVSCTDTLIELPVDFRTCTNNQCPKHNQRATTPYCPECGHPIQSVAQRRIAKRADQHQITKKLDEVFVTIDNFDLGKCFWICNKENPTFYLYDIRTVDRLALTYAEEYGFRIERGNKSGILSPDDGLELFQSMYKKELEVLIEAYGEANVEVLWGILNWVN
jgi:hypothetical protein